MHNESLLNYFLSKDEPIKSCLLALRSIILEHHTDITETQKWGMPCFCYKKKVLCYLWTDKNTNEPYILWVAGKHLHFPELEEGKRSKMKILRVSPNTDIPIHTIQQILQQALEFCG